MTEAETITALNEISEVIATYSSLWVSFTFGYLTVAYFLGKALSLFQCLVISALYCIAAAFFGTTVIVFTAAWHIVREATPTLYDQVPFVGLRDAWFWGSVLFLNAGTLVSLYFMYNARSQMGKSNPPPTTYEAP
jgi:hypothetical protein